MAAAITPKTNPLLDSGEEFIIIMLCIVAKPDNPNPPININGKIHIDPNIYEYNAVYNKVNEYYKYYYDKHNKQ